MLVLQNLSASIKGRPILKDMNYKLKRGQLTYIMGANGAGKSTLLNALSGTCEVTKGKIILEKKDITNLNKSDYISRVFQDPMVGTFPDLSIYENFIIAGSESRKKKGFLTRIFSKFAYAYKNKDFLQKYIQRNLGYRIDLDKKMSELSGGQRQVLSILMASLRRKPILLLDEPLAALDPQRRKKVSEFIERLVRKNRLYAFMITHHKIDPNASYIKLSKGRITESA